MDKVSKIEEKKSEVSKNDNIIQDDTNAEQFSSADEMFKQFDPNMKQKEELKTSKYDANQQMKSIGSITKLPDGNVIDYEYLKTLDEKLLEEFLNKWYPSTGKLEGNMDKKEEDKIKKKNGVVKKKIRDKLGVKNPKRKDKETKKIETNIKEEVIDLNEKSDIDKMIDDIIMAQESMGKKIYSRETLKTFSRIELNKKLSEFINDATDEDLHDEAETALRYLMYGHTAIELGVNMGGNLTGIGPVMSGATYKLFKTEDKRAYMKSLMPKLIARHPSIKKYLTPEASLISTIFSSDFEVITSNMVKLGSKLPFIPDKSGNHTQNNNQPTQTPIIIQNDNQSTQIPINTQNNNNNQPTQIPIITQNDINNGLNLDSVTKLISDEKKNYMK